MTLAQRLAAVLAELPALKVSPEAIEAAIARHRPASLDAINFADLVLAVAALEGDRAAQAEVDRRLVAVCRSINARGLELDELFQRARTHVFVGPPPRLATYSGRGALAQWLRAVVLTVLSRERRQRPLEALEDEDARRLVSPGPSQDSKLFDVRRARLLHTALTKALEGFTADERTMLKLRFIDGLAHDGVAKLFKIHRTTAMRTLDRCHARLMERLPVELELLGLSSSDLRSLTRLFESSLPRLLAAAFDGKPA